MRGFVKKVCKTVMAMVALLFCYTLWRNDLWGVRTINYLISIFCILLMIVMIWIPRKVLNKSSKQNITMIEIFQIPSYEVMKSYKSSTDMEVINSIKQICEKHFKAFPYRDESVHDMAIKIVIEKEVEKYEFCLYQATVNSNWFLTAWDRETPYYLNAFQTTDEERAFLERLLS